MTIRFPIWLETRNNCLNLDERAYNKFLKLDK